MATAGTARPGRPRDPKKREAILDSAQRLFYARGVANVALEEVSAEAAVSRQTLYSHFGGKSALLAAVVERESTRVLAAMDEFGPAGQGGLRARLVGFAQAYLGLIVRPDVQAFDRFISVEARDNPKFAQAFFAAGPERVLERLSDLLRDECAENLATFDGAEPAARVFLAILLGDLLLRDRYGITLDLGTADLEKRAERSADFFLRALGLEAQL